MRHRCQRISIEAPHVRSYECIGVLRGRVSGVAVCGGWWIADFVADEVDQEARATVPFHPVTPHRSREERKRPHALEGKRGVNDESYEWAEVQGEKGGRGRSER